MSYSRFFFASQHGQQYQAGSMVREMPCIWENLGNNSCSLGRRYGMSSSRMKPDAFPKGDHKVGEGQNPPFHHSALR